MKNMRRGGPLTNHQKIRIAFFVVASLFVFYATWKIFEPYALTLASALLAAVVLAPAHAWLSRFFNQHPRISAFFLTLLMVVVVGLPFILATFFLFQQLSELAVAIQNNQLHLDTIIFQSPIFQSLPTDLQNVIRSFDFPNLVSRLGAWLANNFSGLVASTATYAFLTVLFFFGFYYFLAEREMIYRKILALSPLANRVDNTIINRLTSTVRAVVVGNVVVGIIQGLLAGIGFIVFGLPAAAIWSLLTIVAAQIPAIGTAVTVLPASAYLAFTGHGPEALGLLLWGLLLVGTIDNFIKPKIVEGQTKMHALLILIAMVGGIQLFGPIGFILGPAVLAAALAFLDLYEGGVLEGKFKL